jgi:hypothetical protein
MFVLFSLTSSRKPKNIDDTVQVLADLAEARVAHDVISDLWVAKLLDVPPRSVLKTLLDVSPHHVLLVGTRLERLAPGMRQA